MSGQEGLETRFLSLPTALLGLTFSTILASPASSAQPCAPTRLGANVSNQPEVWRRAVEALVASTGTPGQPWSCVGGAVDVVVGPEGAKLEVVDADGHAISRQVASPDDVGPLGEALLAKPLPLASEVAAVSEKPIAPELGPKKEEMPSPVPREPRVFVAATIGPRYAGPAHLLWGGLNVTAAVPFGPWAGGLWIRYDDFSTALSMRQPPMSELSIGATAFRRFSLGRIELRPALKPSLAVVTRVIEPRLEGVGLDPRAPGSIEQTRINFRIGAEGQIVVPITRLFRAMLTIDGEVAPGALFETTHSSRDGEIDMRFPQYTVGLGVGMEVAVP